MTGSRDTATIIGPSRGRFFLPSVLLWALFVSSAAQSATATLSGTPIDVFPGVNVDFNSANVGNLTISQGGYYRGLNVTGSTDAYTIITKTSSTPASSAPHAVTYSLAAVSPLPVGNFDPTLLTWFGTSVDSLTQLLTGGQSYILRLTCSGCSRVDNNLIATPLPAAAWLFGSALVGFIMLSNRRAL